MQIRRVRLVFPFTGHAQLPQKVCCSVHMQVGEVLRGIGMHFARFIDGMSDKDFRAAQLGLAHAYSRSKVRGGDMRLSPAT